MTAGHPIEPADTLLAWLVASASRDGRRSRCEIPVVVHIGSPLVGVTEAFIGADIGTRAQDRIALELDDGALGISLIDQLRHRCGDGAAACAVWAAACAVWLEGYWGPLVGDSSPAPGASPGAHPFAVLRVGELIGEGDERAALARVQSSQ